MRDMLKIKNMLIVMVLMIIFSGTAFAAVDPLYIGVGARPLGMGRAYVAVAENTDAIFVNPAGLAGIDSLKLTSMYTNLMSDVQYVMLGGVYPYLNHGVLGIGVVTAGTGGILLYDGSGTPTGTADWRSSVLFLSYGLSLAKFDVPYYLKPISLGANLKYFNETAGGPDVEGGNGNGLDMDLGLTYKPINWLTIGGCGQNILGTNMTYQSGIEELIPSNVKLGAKVEVLGKEGLIVTNPQRLITAVDYDMDADKRVHGAGHVGVEYWPLDMLGVRLGLDQDPAPANTLDVNPTAGVSLRYRGFEFSYAYHPYTAVPENTTHYFSISYIGEEKKEAPKPAQKMLKLNLTSPEDKLITYDRSVDVVGSVEGTSSGTSLEVSKISAPLSGEGVFSVSSPLKIGKSLIVVKASDETSINKEVSEKLRILRLTSFKDVASDFWAKRPIEYLATAGVIEGYPDKTFKPDRTLTRAELATLLVRAKGVTLPKVKGKVFKDLPRTHWAASYIKAAQDLGLVKGYPDGTFKPNSKINRNEGVMIMARFGGLIPPERVLERPYKDMLVDHWAAAMITAAKDAGYLAYLEKEVFEGRKGLSRAEAAEILGKTSFGKAKIDNLLDFEVGFEEVTAEAKAAVKLISFVDIGEGYWAKKPIEELATVGIISGYPDGSFKPDKPLTRAEFATLLVKAKGIELPVVRGKVFSDLRASHWASRYIKAAVNLGLVKGYPDGSFKPNKPLTRAEGVMVFIRFDGLGLPEVLEERPFPDVPRNYWAIKAIAVAKSAGFLDYIGSGDFMPDRPLTRAEACEILSKTTFGKAKIKELYGEEVPEKIEGERARSIREDLGAAAEYENSGNEKMALSQYKQVLERLLSERNIKRDEINLDAERFEEVGNWQAAIREYKRSIQEIIYGKLVSEK